MLFKHLYTYGKFFSPDGDSGGGAGANDGGGEGGDGSNDGNGAGADANEGDKDDTAGLKSALDKERTDRKTAQKELRDALKRLADLENAGKPEAEQAEKRVKDAEDKAARLEALVREKAGKAAVASAATKANAIDADAIHALVASKLEFDDDGEPTNVDDVIEAARTDHPKLFKHAGGSGDGGKGGDGKPEPTPGFGRLLHAYETNSKTARRR